MTSRAGQFQRRSEASGRGLARLGGRATLGGLRIAKNREEVVSDFRGRGRVKTQGEGTEPQRVGPRLRGGALSPVLGGCGLFLENGASRKV